MLYTRTSSKEIAKNSNHLLLEILLICAKCYNILSAKIFGLTVMSRHHKLTCYTVKHDLPTYFMCLNALQGFLVCIDYE